MGSGVCQNGKYTDINIDWKLGNSIPNKKGLVFCGIDESPLVRTIVDGGNHPYAPVDDVFKFSSPMGTKILGVYPLQ